jgi:hypothetical protein
MTGRRIRPPAAWLSAATVAATATGGTLGVVLQNRWTPAVPVLVIGLGVIALIGVVMIDVQGGRVEPRDDAEGPDARRPPSRGVRQWPEASDRHPALPEPRAPDDAVAPERPPDRPGDDRVTIALPVPSPGQWWTRGAPITRDAPGPQPPVRRVAVPDLESYLESSLLAQCPNCGSFDLAVLPSQPGYEFACDECGRRWAWQPGQPWPRLRVSPRRRRSGSPSSA